jgi:Recombinase zinc beta ribbon domain
MFRRSLDRERITGPPMTLGNVREMGGASALLQGIAICGCCGRRMRLRYTGPNGDDPVYCCRFDRDQRASKT